MLHFYKKCSSESLRSIADFINFLIESLFSNFESKLLELFEND